MVTQDLKTGDKISCVLDRVTIEEAIVNKRVDMLYICQNMKNGGHNNIYKYGYDYAWVITEDDNKTITNIELLEKEYKTIILEKI